MMTQSEIDLLQAEECIGKKVSLSLDPESKGHIVRVCIVPGCRMYTIQWCDEGCITQGDVYGFQMSLEE